MPSKVLAKLPALYKYYINGKPVSWADENTKMAIVEDGVLCNL